MKRLLKLLLSSSDTVSSKRLESLIAFTVLIFLVVLFAIGFNYDSDNYKITLYILAGIAGYTQTLTILKRRNQDNL